RSLAGGGAGCFSPDASKQAFKGVFVIEAGAEVDPSEATKEARKLLLAELLPTGQQDRNHSNRMIADPFGQRGPHLFVLPGADHLADEHRAGAALVESLLQRLLPGLAGDEVPLVEERLDSRLAQLGGEALDRRLVAAGVAEKDVVAGHSASLEVLETSYSRRPVSRGFLVPVGAALPSWRPGRLRRPGRLEAGAPSEKRGRSPSCLRLALDPAAHRQEIGAEHKRTISKGGHCDDCEPQARLDDPDARGGGSGDVSSRECRQGRKRGDRK